MLKNYLAIAFRSLSKNLLHTTINIIGLSIGVSSCLVIYLIVSFELSYNTAIPEAERIYRVYSNFSGTFDGTNRGVTTGTQAMVIEQFTGLETVAAVNTMNATVKVAGDEDKKFDSEKGIAVVGPQYFQLISGYEWLSGSPESSLSKPLQVVLSEHKAKKYFGSDDPQKMVGKELRYNDSLIVSVSGIVKPLPYRSDFEFTDFISYSSIEKSFLKKGNMEPDNWESTNSSNQLFIKLNKSTPVSVVEEQMKKVDAAYKTKNSEAGWFLTFKLQPLSNLHFNGNLGIFDSSRSPANKSTLTTLTIVALLLLLIASINFINLETAQAAKRAREVGVRKVLGSSRMQLIYHFLGQSVILAVVAVLISLPLAEVGLVLFSDFIPPGVGLNIFTPTTLLFLVGVTFIVGVLSGIYPAFVLSSFLPALALKNQAYINSTNTRSAFLRKGLIIFQFGFAQVLIIGTFVVLSQINFMLTKDLGFEKDAIINFRVAWTEPKNKRLVLKNELERLKEVEMVHFAAEHHRLTDLVQPILSIKRKDGKKLTPWCSGNLGMKIIYRCMACRSLPEETYFQRILCAKS